MPRYAIRLAYDGTLFHGWQIQPDVRSVQQTIEDALFSLFADKIAVTGSGRTDAGVHALAQYAHFDLNKDLQPKQLLAALNTKLPDDIYIKNCWIVDKDFSARYSAFARTYEYHLALSYSPHYRNYRSWLPRIKFSTQDLDKCWQYFCGEHDFSSFARFNPDLSHQICNIHAIDAVEKRQEYIIRITANRFLHNMVRRIVGTAVMIAHSHTEPAIITQLINALDTRHKLIYCAPPQGLFLVQIRYQDLPDFYTSDFDDQDIIIK